MTQEHFKTLPWNGHKAAISLTFDDGELSQIQFAIPEMAKRDIRGTFYLIHSRLTEIEAWKDAFNNGQELGNHSLDHKHPIDLTPQNCQEQVQESRKRLEETFKVSAHTFAYPFTEITPSLREAAHKSHFLSRGGYGPVYMTSDQEPDWEYLASQVIYSHTSSGILKGWTDLNIQNNTWSIPQFHAFLGTGKGWQPLPPATFTDFLDDLAARKKDIWIAPLGEVGAYRMAEIILQKAKHQTRNEKHVFTWEKPALLPNVSLKIRCADSTVFQKGTQLKTGPDGSFNIDFNLEELTLVRA